MNDITKPVITTIIPTYQRPKLLRRAIKSVLNQTYPHFQVCVYDNASGDETAEVVAEIAKEDPRVKYHCHPENIGALANFNYGMKHVITPFFSMLSDDDILLPSFYQIALAGFEKYPEVIFSSTLALVGNLTSDYQVNNIRDPFGSNWKPGFYQPPKGLLAMLKNGYPSWTGILFRKDVIEKIGILDEEVGLATDLDFELRAAAHFPFVISSKPGAISVTHTERLSLQDAPQDRWPNYLKIICNLMEDEHIPLETRIHAKHIFVKRFLFYEGISSILQRNDEDTYKIIKALGEHLRLKKMAFILSTMDKICRYFPPIYYSSVLLNKFRKFLFRIYRQRRPMNLYKKY